MSDELCQPSDLEGGLRLVGDPVDVVTGAVSERLADARVKDVTDLVVWRRYDTSRLWEDRGLGPGHSWEFDEEVVVDLEGLRYRSSDGTIYTFDPLYFDGAEAIDRGFVLRRRAAGHYEVTRTGEPLRTFVASRRDPDRARIVSIGEGPSRIAFDYDENGLLRRVTSAEHALEVEWAEGHVSRIVRPVQGTDGYSRPQELVRYRYDQAWNLVEVVDFYKGSHRREYDAAHRMLRRTNASGYSVEFAYDSSGRCVRSAGQDGVLEVRLEYFAIERRTLVTHSNGGVVTYLFDASGTITHVVDALGGVTEYVVVDGRIVAVVDPAGNTTEFVHDVTGVRTHAITPLGEKRPWPVTPGLTKDAYVSLPDPLAWEWGLEPTPPERLPLAHEVPTPLVQDRVPIATTTSPLRPERPIYDSFGNLARIDRDGGDPRRFGYDASGNLKFSVDFDGLRTEYDHRSWNHLQATTDPLGRTVQLRWTKEEELETVIDAGGSRTDYRHDLAGRLSEVHRGGRLLERYAYDPAGKLVAKHAGTGEEILRFEIGPGGKKSKRILASGDEHEFTYDSFGRFLTAKGQAGEVRFGYELDGRVRYDERDGAGVRHRYDASGRIVETRTLGRFVTRYVHLEGGVRIVVDPTDRSHRVESQGDGIFRRSLSNGVVEVSQFDQKGRCVRKDARGLRAAGAINEAWTRAWHYSSEGDLLCTDDSDRGATLFAHDAAHRIAGVMLPDGSDEAYAYDAGDNLVRAPGLSATFAAGNLLVGTAEETFGYDGRECIAERIRHAQSDAGASLHANVVGRVLRYTRDSRGQLTRIDGLEAIWEAAYDALGRRTMKRFGAAEWTYHWDGDRLAAEELPSGGLRVYVYQDERSLVPWMRVDYVSRDVDSSEGERFYLFANHLGGVERVVDDGGRTVWRAESTPYGVRNIVAEFGFDQPIRWPGHYYDDETGLQYNRFRYYDPSLGRYLEPDPQGLRGGLNAYAYTRNPLVGVDLRGLSDVCPTTGRPIEPEPAADGADAQAAPRTAVDANGRLRVAAGEDGAGRFVQDPNAPASTTRPRPTQVATAADMPDGRPIPGDHPAVRDRQAAAARDASDPRRQQDMRSASERMGEAAADQWAADNGLTSVHDGSGSGTFDRIYQNQGTTPVRIQGPDGGTIEVPPGGRVVVEAKGGSATNSSSRGVGNERFQQGTPQYQRDVATNMARSGDEHAEAVRDAIASGNPPPYIEVSQPVRSDGTPGPVGVRQYTGSRPNPATTPSTAPTGGSSVPTGPPTVPGS